MSQELARRSDEARMRVGGHGKPDAARVERLGAEITELLRRIDESYVEVASRLYQVRGEFQKCRNAEQAKCLLGHETLKDWLSAVVGDRGRRRAFYYLSIWRTLHEGAGVKVQELREIGWTRAKEVVRVAAGGAAPGKVRTWVERAKQVTAADLAKEVAAAVAQKTVAPAEKMHLLRFALFDAQLAVVEQAVRLAKSMGTDADGEALTNICQEFLGGSSGWTGKGREDFLKVLLRSIEVGWGLRIMVEKAAP